ncbi:cupin domain-containing protein [Paenibacillus sp. y28]|uniref:cupin domain-containing protein n=1 Tax=Paenibacillus sp. y28 TaxID=3129110 RepID=UPI003019B996
MEVRSFLKAEMRHAPSHKGIGEVRSVKLYSQEDFETPLRFLYDMELPPGTSIGYHPHQDDEEMYIILEGSGMMTVNGEAREVRAGDTILNKPYGSHGLYNHSQRDLKLLVYEAANRSRSPVGPNNPG